MNSVLRYFTVLLAAFALAAIGGPASAQPKDKPPKEQKEQKGGQKEDKEKKPKKAKHQDGKNLVGDKIKKNGKHKFHENGKHSASVDVVDGKIRGVSVTHAEKGAVPVKKYKTNKKMAEASAGGMQPVSMVLAQTQYLGTTWIGYAYIDDWGDEVIYWFPYDMIYDGDTGAVEYVPAY
jgi:predicted small lipoprotein YifL